MLWNVGDDATTQFAADFANTWLERRWATITRPFRRPVLDLVYEGDHDPFLMTEHIFRQGQEVPGRWFRVAVINSSRSEIGDVRVRATRLRPARLPVLPQILRHMGNDPPQPVESMFAVRAGRQVPEFVDVVSKVTGFPSIQLHHINDAVRRDFPAGSYRLTLEVTGTGSKPRTRDFVIRLNRSRELLFRPARDPRSW
jgi:hypothetical protein